MSIGASYRFLGTDAPTWDVRGGGHIRFDRGRTHCVGMTFTLKF
jgi:hypothetical protein